MPETVKNEEVLALIKEHGEEKATVLIRQAHILSVVEKFAKDNAELIGAVKNMPTDKLDTLFIPELLFAMELKSRGL
jgi:hypothetical protein